MREVGPGAEDARTFSHQLILELLYPLQSIRKIEIGHHAPFWRRLRRASPLLPIYYTYFGQGSAQRFTASMGARSGSHVIDTSLLNSRLS